MKYRNTVYDFIRRTRANLDTIEQGAKSEPDKYFEVTQLINSVIGLLMFPKEAVYDMIPQKKLSELKEVKLPKVLYGRLPEDNLQSLIRYMRNGFAHYNVQFESVDNQISGLYIWNKKPSGKIDWVAYISIPDLKSLLNLASREFAKLTKGRPNVDALLEVEKKLGTKFARHHN